MARCAKVLFCSVSSHREHPHSRASSNARSVVLLPWSAAPSGLAVGQVRDDASFAMGALPGLQGVGGECTVDIGGAAACRYPLRAPFHGTEEILRHISGGAFSAGLWGVTGCGGFESGFGRRPIHATTRTPVLALHM